MISHEEICRGLLKADVAVVTGAAQGNGAAIARGLARAGARVAAVDREADRLQTTVEAIRAEGGAISGHVLDITDLAAGERFASEVEQEHGPVSVLVNNAGIVRRVLVEEEGFLASVKDQFAINTLASAQMVKLLIGQLKRTQGRIIHIGSIASFRATTGGVGYGASKGAVRLMIAAMAEELAQFGIRVNGVAPGIIITPMTEPTRSNPDVAGRFLEHIPLKRFGEADELVGPVLFLASSLSSYVTGVLLPVDGGYLAV